MFHETQSGTPQGGIISPLLANIALDGLDNLLSQYKKTKVYQSKNKKTGKVYSQKKKLSKYGFNRYADDFIVTAETKEDIEEIIPVITEVLREKGLELNQEKTRITHVEEGFNYLGYHIRRFKVTLKLPQKEKVLAKLKEIRAWLKNNINATPEKVIGYLNPIIRGFANFYRHGSSKSTLSYFDHKVFKALWRWALKRHSTQNNKWGKKRVKKKYFRYHERQEWTFFAKIKDRRGKPKNIHIFRASSIPIEYHVKVEGRASPDDPKLTKYWKDRQTKYGKSYWPKGSKLREIAQRQKWKCPVCGEQLFNDIEGKREELHTHHIVQVKDGGTDNKENLTLMHKTCHQHLHSRGKNKDVSLELSDA